MAKERYSAFGERRRGESPLITDQLYTGQRYNALSSLYHYSDGTSAGRFYDPLLARFVQPDPVTPGIGSQSLNRYSYVLNAPLNRIDPSGHASMADNPGGEWGSPVAVHAVYNDELFGLFMTAYPQYNAHTDPVLANPQATPWAYVEVEGTRAAIQFQQGRWATQRGQGDGLGLMLAGAAIMVVTMGEGGDGGTGNEGPAEAASQSGIVRIEVSRSRYPEAAKHIEDAQAAGHPSTLTIDRPGTDVRRAEAMKRHPIITGLDRDEYPPAMFKEGGTGASVRSINSAQNRGAGACIGNACRSFPDGTQVEVVIVP